MTNYKLSKTTLKFAVKRNLDVFVQPADSDNGQQVWIYEEDSDMEPLCIYSVEDTGLFLHCNIYLTQEQLEEIPYWIKNEKHLRDVVKFIADTL